MQDLTPQTLAVAASVLVREPDRSCLILSRVVARLMGLRTLWPEAVS